MDEPSWSSSFLGSIGSRWRPELLHELIDREGAWPLAGWKLSVGGKMLADDRLSRHEHEGVLDEPFHIVAGLVVRALEGIGAKVEQLRCAKGKHGLHPDLE